MRKDLVEWAKERFDEVPSPTSRSGSRTTRCAGTSPTRSSSRPRPSTARSSSTRLKRAPPSARTATRSSRRAPARSRARRSARGSPRTLAELYRAEIDATGQPMSPEPFAAVAERDRALPDRRDPDLDLRRREQSKWLEEGLIEKVERDHRQAGRARRGRRRRAPRRPRPSRRPAAGSRGGSLMESALASPSTTPTSTTARPRPTRARGSTARRSGSCSSSSRR